MSNPPMTYDINFSNSALRFAVLLALPLSLLIVGTLSAGEAGKFSTVANAMREQIAKHEIAGAVTLVANRDKVLSLEATGQADVAAGKPMATDSICWIASMTKPITATAILMMQEEGKLSVDDPVAKYLPELADLKTAEGKPGNLTLRHLLTHTSGMSEATPEQYKTAKPTN